MKPPEEEISLPVDELEELKHYFGIYCDEPLSF